MKRQGSITDSFNIGSKKKLEPSILWNKDFPLTHIPLILLVQGISAASMEKKLLKRGCRELHFFSIINAFYAMVPQSKLKEIVSMPSVYYITYNHSVFSFMEEITGDLSTIYPTQHYGVTGRSISIAHLDTGIHPHGDLVRPRKRILAFKDFIKDSASPYDDHGHGTLCAGCIAGNGVLSKGKYKGVAPDSLLIGLKCLNEGGIGDLKSSLMALQWVYDNSEKYRIRILHIPFGAYYPYSLTYDPLVMAVEKIWDKGMVVVCAAGNRGPQKGTIASPGTSSKVITVGSCAQRMIHSSTSSICRFSSRGPVFSGESKPDLIAPGKDIVSIYNNPLGVGSSYRSFTGTSVSSSIVTGAVALLLERQPELSPDEVKLALEMSCTSLHLEKHSQGKGCLNIEGLLHMEL